MEDLRADGSSSLWYGFIVNNVFYKQWSVKKNVKLVLMKPAVEGKARKCKTNPGKWKKERHETLNICYAKYI